MNSGMGRPKSVWHDLPPRMSARRLASGKVLYYYQAAGKKIPLGSNLLAAKQEWARHEAGPRTLFPDISKLYRAAALPTLAFDTKKHYEGALKRLDAYLEKVSLEQIEPKHVKDYLRRRSSKGAGMFERRILSALFNWARENGYTKAANPCHGMKFSQAERKAFKYTGKRGRYVTDAEFDHVYSRAPWLLQDAMDLALLTGQRPSDLFRATRQDIRDGVLWIEQGKTGAKVGIKVQGAIASAIERAQKRSRRIQSVYLIADAKGQPLNVKRLNGLFVKARGEADWQFRDLRAKAASDSPNLKKAQLLLGHATEATTAGVYRRTKGHVVAPLKRRI